MKTSIRAIFSFATVSLVLALSGTAQAQSYPVQPIKLLVPFAPGGAVDQIARAIGPELSRRLGQPLVVENRAGASGSVGAGELARAKPDGYTLMLALDSQAVNNQMIKNLPFDTLKSFDYLSLLVTAPQVLVVRNSLPVTTVRELVSYIRSKPGTPYGSAGTGSAGHINSASLSVAYDLQATHIPYRGAGPLLTDLLGSHIDFAFASLTVMLPHIKAGTVRAIALSSAKRNPQLPNVPTVSENLPDFEIPTWIGLVAPVGLPTSVREKVLKATRETMAQPEVRSRLAENAFEVVNSTPEVFVARIKKDSEVMANLVRRKVITAE